jgi:Winged helix-turn helix
MQYCRERGRQLLHELGFRLRRLRHRHLKAKPEAQAAFRAALAALLAEWPEDGEWLFVDEATGRCHPTLPAQWCVAEEVPEVPTGEDPTQVHVYGAVAPLRGRTHDHVSPALGREECAQVLPHRLVSSPGTQLLAYS